MNSYFLNGREPEAVSLGIKSLDYIHLMETQNDLLLPKNVDDAVCLNLFKDPIWIMKLSRCHIYNEETDNYLHYTDFPHYDLGWYFEKRKRCYRWLNMNGIETGYLFENVTYDYGFYYDEFFNYPKNLRLRLGSADLKILLSKKSALDLHAWGGHLFKEFRLKILNSKNKAQTFATVLKMIEMCSYCTYHDPYVLANQFELYLGLLDRLHSQGEMPTYTQNAVKLLQLFTHNPEVIKILLIQGNIDIRNLIHVSRREKYIFFNLWNHLKDTSSMSLTDFCLMDSMKDTEILLLNGGTNNYTFEAYEIFKKYTQFIIRRSGLPAEFIANLNEVKKCNRIKYRCLQVICIYYDDLINNLNIYEHLRTSILKLIWKNISEPFLIKEDFMSMLVTEENKNAYYQLNEVWKWYMINVSMEKIPLKQTPRSLHHLSANTIRKELIRCFNFPNGIPDLPLPKHLKKELYLSIQDNNISVIAS